MSFDNIGLVGTISAMENVVLNCMGVHHMLVGSLFCITVCSHLLSYTICCGDGGDGGWFEDELGATSLRRCLDAAAEWRKCFLCPLPASWH